jgi:hypothetical protein
MPRNENRTLIRKLEKNSRARRQFLVLPLGAKLAPRGENPQFAPPYFYINSTYIVITSGGERRGEYFTQGIKVHPRGQVHL